MDDTHPIVIYDCLLRILRCVVSISTEILRLVLFLFLRMELINFDSYTQAIVEVMNEEYHHCVRCRPVYMYRDNGSGDDLLDAWNARHWLSHYWDGENSFREEVYGALEMSVENYEGAEILTRIKYLDPSLFMGSYKKALSLGGYLDFELCSNSMCYIIQRAKAELVHL